MGKQRGPIFGEGGPNGTIGGEMGHIESYESIGCQRVSPYVCLFVKGHRVAYAT